MGAPRTGEVRFELFLPRTYPGRVVSLLKEPMRGADLNKVLGITWGGNFLAKHCLGTGSSATRFVRVSRGLYHLKDSH
jgi:hypothetical protein